METNNGGDEVGMKAFERYFDYLVAAAINKKSVLDKLEDNNAKIAATNKDLVTIVNKLSKEINYLEQET